MYKLWSNNEGSRQAPLGCSGEVGEDDATIKLASKHHPSGQSCQAQHPASCKHCPSWLPFIWKVWQTMAALCHKHVSSWPGSSCTTAEFVQKIWAEQYQNALWQKINHYRSPRELRREVMGFAKLRRVEAAEGSDTGKVVLGWRWRMWGVLGWLHSVFLLPLSRNRVPIKSDNPEKTNFRLGRLHNSRGGSYRPRRKDDYLQKFLFTRSPMCILLTFQLH